MALALPTARGRRCVPPAPGMMPSLISGWPNLALSAAMMKSHIIASSQPPPRAKPLTAAITGLRMRADGFPVAGDVVALVDVGKGVFGHGADVGAGGKGLFAAGDDHAADGLVGIKGLERCAQLVHELVVERVELLGAVQRDDADLFGFGAHLIISGFMGFVRFLLGWIGLCPDYTQGKTLADRSVG
jgi:hypothetical protein